MSQGALHGAVHYISLEVCWGASRQQPSAFWTSWNLVLCLQIQIRAQWSDHCTMIIAPWQHRPAQTQLCSLLYLKHKRHLLVTFTLSAGLGFRMDVPILPTKAKPVCEADLAWAWVFLPGKSVVSFQMWVRLWAGVWALGSHDSSGYELRYL